MKTKRNPLIKKEKERIDNIIYDLFDVSWNRTQTMKEQILIDKGRMQALEDIMRLIE